MFRLFLRKKILSAIDKAKGGPAPESVEPPKRNRRISERFNVDHKHLTLMNDQDILLVREISPRGFSSEVSPRGFERLTIGDVYDARARYVGEIHALQVRVAWKLDSVVGFEIVKAGRDTLAFIKRLIRPIEIAASLRAVETSFTTEGNIGKTWYHGDENSDLYTWHHPETNELKAWQLEVGETYIEWSENRGLATGSLGFAKTGQGEAPRSTLASPRHAQDQSLDGKKRQFAVDVMMAFGHDVRDEILETLTG